MLILLTLWQALQAFLVILAFATTVLRCWVRVKLGRHRITLPDYLVIVGWFCTVGWFACSVTALRLEHDRPLTGPELLSDSVEYLTVRLTKLPCCRRR